MKLAIQYYALLRDQRGLSAEQIETDAATPGELYAELAALHGFTLSRKSMKVAVNDEFASWDAPLQSGDSIVFIPPVAGG